MANKKRVLFLCTGNSARSQMAEGLLRHMAGDRYDGHSAGTEPKGLHPRTIEGMNEPGVDVSGYQSKHLDRFIGQRFDYVITVCGHPRDACPVFPSVRATHWGFDDPAAAEDENQLREFRRVRDEILQRMVVFVSSGQS